MNTEIERIRYCPPTVAEESFFSLLVMAASNTELIEDDENDINW